MDKNMNNTRHLTAGSRRAPFSTLLYARSPPQKNTPLKSREARLETRQADKVGEGEQEEKNAGETLSRHENEKSAGPLPTHRNRTKREKGGAAKVQER
jgi:hypothetical protein